MSGTMFGSKKEDAYKAIEEITNVIIGRAGFKMPPQVVKEYRESKRGAELLWEYAMRNIISSKNVNMDMEESFAGLSVDIAKERLDGLVNALWWKEKYVPFRIVGFHRRYYITFISDESMTKLKKTLANYNGEYDSWFDFDIYNMIKLAEKSKLEKVKIPPLSPDSKILESMEAIVRRVSNDALTDIMELRNELSKEQEADQNSVKEQAYWGCLLGVIQSYYIVLQDHFEAVYVIEKVRDVVNDNLGLDEDVDFSEFYVPEEVGTYKALSILARELEDKNILLGWMESPDEKNGHIREDLTEYQVLAVNNGDRNSLERLFADCGGAVHFDFNDPKRLVAPVREQGPLARAREASGKR